MLNCYYYFVYFQVFYGVDVEPKHIVMKRSADQPLRIHLHYDDSLNELPLDHRNLVKVIFTFLLACTNYRE